MSRKIYLLGALLVASFAANASTLCATPASLTALNGTVVVCGNMTYDFTGLTFVNGVTGFGPGDTSGGTGDGNGGTLSASNILVSIYFGGQINFSVTGGPGNFLANQGTGYSTYDIEYNVAINVPQTFSGVSTVGHNLNFLTSGGEISVNKDVIYGPTDIGAGFDELNSPGPFSTPFVTSGRVELKPTTTTAHIIDFVQLNPQVIGGTTGTVSMDSFDNNFLTPEPATLLLIGSALVGIGAKRRKTLSR